MDPAAPAALLSAVAEGTTESKKGHIVARGLSHAFGATARSARGRGDGERRSAVLKDVDLEVRSGEFFCIVGGSGCGKTTLLRVLAGLLRPEAGEVSVGGRTVEGPRPEVGFLFQQPVLLEWRTVLENVLLPLEVGHGGSHRSPWRGRKSSEAKRARALELLAGVGLEGYEHHRPDQLSGGMQQRVALARTLLPDPEVLLMDEPFGALDAITRGAMQTLLLGLWERLERTVVFVTHDIAEAVFLADRVAVMGGRPGRIEAVFPVDIPRPRPASLRYEGHFAARCRPVYDVMEKLHGPLRGEGTDG